MSALVFRERPAAAEAGGLLVLHQGRGSDENDLLSLADVLDPQRHLHVVTPRAPLTLPSWPGYHWYRVPRVGYPDPDTFSAAYQALTELHDELWQRTGISPARTIFGGFSMGTVMSYALGLGAERPSPAGIMAFSGFIPVVDGWLPQLEDRVALRVFIAHGDRDPVIDVKFARRARDQLSAGMLATDYREFGGGHEIEPANLGEARDWLDVTLPRAALS